MQVHSGYCSCCRKVVDFTIFGESLRDQYICNSCNSIPRQRHLQYILDRHFPGWEALDIHESSPSNDFISRYAKSYSYSHYIPNVPFGKLSPSGVRSENLESLTLSSNSVDIFITQDVLEHVFSPEKAIREITRVLKPGGAHLFTTPKYEVYQNSFARAIIDEDNIVHNVHSPVFHGNPVGDGKSLVTWDYGDDFEYLLAVWSGMPVATYITRDREFGIDAPINEVFVIRKRPDA